VNIWQTMGGKYGKKRKLYVSPLRGSEKPTNGDSRGRREKQWKKGKKKTSTVDGGNVVRPNRV